jgi:acyl-homoserine-lactone acylase
VAVAALGAASETVARKYKSADVAWGDVYRVRRDGKDLPSSGAGSEYGVYHVVGYTEAKDGKFEVAGGTGFVALVQFSNPLRAMTQLGYGNASRTGSPHRTDQLVLFAEKRLKPAWRTRAEVESHLERRERF